MPFWLNFWPWFRMTLSHQPQSEPVDTRAGRNSESVLREISQFDRSCRNKSLQRLGGDPVDCQDCDKSPIKSLGPSRSMNQQSEY